MNVLAGMATGTNVVTSVVLWTVVVGIVAVVIATGIGIGIERFIAAARTATEPVHAVTPCGIKGHRFRVHHAGWRCTICGEGVLHEGEMSQPVTGGAAAVTRAA